MTVIELIERLVRLPAWAMGLEVTIVDAEGKLLADDPVSSVGVALDFNFPFDDDLPDDGA